MLDIRENRSSPLCLCCERVDFMVECLENDVNKIDSSRHKNASFPVIRVNELENRIPRTIDNGFTNSTRDALVLPQILLYVPSLNISSIYYYRYISVPLGNRWNDIKNAWNQPDNKSFDVGPFLTFLDENTHKIPCRSDECRWCIVSSTVDQV